MDQDEREAASRARSAELLERTEPTPEELAEQAERARRNRAYEIMASTPAPLPPPSEKQAGDATRTEYASRKWVSSSLDSLAKALVIGMAKRVNPHLAEIEQSRRSLETHGRAIDRLSNELAELKREAALAKRIAEQNLKRKADLLELENSLLRAGRRPDDAETKAELHKFLENGHAQQ